jgi:hypothetical protein
MGHFLPRQFYQPQAALAGASGGNDALTKLLLHCAGADTSTTFTDSSSSAHTVTVVGNAQIDTAQSKSAARPACSMARVTISRWTARPTSRSGLETSRSISGCGSMRPVRPTSFTTRDRAAVPAFI